MLQTSFATLLCISALSSTLLVSAEKWVLMNEAGNRCLEMDAIMSLSVDYETKTTGINTVKVTPANATVLKAESSCGANQTANASLSAMDQKLAVGFGEGQKLLFLISQDPVYTQNTSKSWNLYKIEFQAALTDTHLFPDAKDTQQTYSNNVFQNGTGSLKFTSNLKEYYTCSPEITYRLGQDCNMTIAAMKLVPYATFDVDGRTAHHCSKESRTNDLVPLIVGASLACLVVVVLIAYIVAHVRANRSKYENVR